jgi:hypothetical protein
MSFWRKILAIVTLPVLLLTMSGTAIVAAQQGGDSGLNISPTRFELKIDPGSSETVKISLKNLSGVDVIAKVEVNDFEADNLTGEPKLIVDPKRESSNSIKPLLKDVSDVPMKKDERKDVDITVSIPAKQPPGGYYGIVRYTAQRESGGAVKGGELFLVEVPGNITEQIQIKSVKVFTGDKDHKKSGSLFTSMPNQVGITIHNLGNSFSKPFGKVNVTNMSGKNIYSYEINNTDPKANILPGSERLFKDDLKNVSTPGRYTITASLSSGTSGQLVNYIVSFWYLPVWFLLAIAGVIGVLIIGAWMIYRKFSHSTRRR